MHVRVVTMNAEQYRAISGPFRKNPQLKRILITSNTALKYLCYVLYPVLLMLVACTRPELLLKETLVPAVLFVAVSAFRYLYNEPRPYETLDIDPLIHKDTTGKSMPSRHIFSVFMIAMCWLYYMVWPGIVLLICGFIMAAIRVIGGVHYPRDVVAGALIAVVGGILGLWVLPLS